MSHLRAAHPSSTYFPSQTRPIVRSKNGTSSLQTPWQGGGRRVGASSFNAESLTTQDRIQMPTALRQLVHVMM
ncbi:hypothetical protein PISMIDRAFT_172971 [Pisolithus microcarpus 441]|uniref:Uncharacterized protein n=1 Tax=Pisolithus microcarpus 441 TaxID=765257 RepID=A0A0C9Z8Y7_9AGAM|nr:hypothetical protein PISMIDRAFT_172971 [Pisolithus microcarpus 441]